MTPSDFKVMLESFSKIFDPTFLRKTNSFFSNRRILRTFIFTTLWIVLIHFLIYHGLSDSILYYHRSIAILLLWVIYIAIWMAMFWTISQAKLMALFRPIIATIFTIVLALVMLIVADVVKFYDWEVNKTTVQAVVIKTWKRSGLSGTSKSHNRHHYTIYYCQAEFKVDGKVYTEEYTVDQNTQVGDIVIVQYSSRIPTNNRLAN